jgi:hypothetical protein
MEQALNMNLAGKRWRVMSFFPASFMGMAPFGSLMAGTLAGLKNAP